MIKVKEKKDHKTINTHQKLKLLSMHMKQKATVGRE